MNIYNLNEFKCSRCQHWFHPKHAQPYTLACSHSLCSPCLENLLDNHPTGSILCPYHKSQQSLDKIKLNIHIQQALERLMKNSQIPQHKRQISSPHSLQKQLQVLLQAKWEDMQAFKELIQRIYGNEINRIMHLRSRIRQEIVGHYQAYEKWKVLIENGGNSQEIMDEGKALETKIKELYSLNLQQMAEKIIDNSSIVLQRNFSIYDLTKKQRRTLKSSVKQNHNKMESSLSSQLGNKSDKQNLNFLVKTVESPQKQTRNQLSSLLCKQLSSFKLDCSLLQQSNLGNSKVIEQFKLSTSILDEPTENNQATLRQNQYSKCSLKTKPCEKREQKLSRFAQLINSLRSEDDLSYSPEISQQMLLSETKCPDINFLQECPIERKEQKRGLQIRKKQLINCDRQNSKYIKKMEEVRTEQALLNTSISGNTLQLFNYELKEVDLKAYLDRFDWVQIQAVKLVSTGLQDAQFNQLLNYLVKTKVHSLILPNNELQDISLDALLNFININQHLKSVSLQRNNINTLHANTRTKIAMLRNRGITLYI